MGTSFGGPREWATEFSRPGQMGTCPPIGGQGAHQKIYLYNTTALLSPPEAYYFDVAAVKASSQA